MSRGFVKEGDQEDIPVVTPRAFLPEGTANHVTHEGLILLRNELESLNNESVAAGNNYVMRNFINAKIAFLKERINNAVEVDLSKAKNDTVSFGAYVRYNDRTIRIVGVDEADIAKGLVSFISPIAKALIGKRIGDSFEMNVPKGTERITIQEISFNPIPLTVMSENKVKTAVLKPEKKAVKKSNINDFEDTVGKEVQDVDLEEHGSGDDEEGARAEAKHFQAEDNPMEFLPIVNERGNIVGRAIHLEIHKGNKVLHPVIHLHVINSKGDTCGLYWWHVAFGDSPEKTLKRKAAESLGLKEIHPKMKKQYILENKSEKELVYVFTAKSDTEIPKSLEDINYRKIFEKD